MRVYAWLRRFPCGPRAGRMEWEGEKLWRVMLDISDMAGSWYLTSSWPTAWRCLTGCRVKNIPGKCDFVEHKAYRRCN